MAKKFIEYNIDGQPVPSVTTILKLLNNPGLTEWIIRVGSKRANQYRDSAANMGSLVHSCIEAVIGGQTPHYPQSEPKLEIIIDNFKQWSSRKVKRWIAMEKAGYNRTLKYAGTIDSIVESQTGKITLLDVKTSKRIRPEYYLQTTGYANFEWFEDCEIQPADIEQIWIVHLDPETLLWEEVCVPYPSIDLTNTWNSIVGAYPWWQKNMNS